MEETIQLVSRDGENLLIVSYAELRKCLDNSFEVLTCSQFNNSSMNALPQIGTPDNNL